MKVYILPKFNIYIYMQYLKHEQRNDACVLIKCWLMNGRVMRDNIYTHVFSMRIFELQATINQFGAYHQLSLCHILLSVDEPKSD